MEQLEESAKVVEKAERYEMLLKLYQLILPIHEQRRDFPALAACYTRLSQACTKADEVSRTGRRLLGTFYRIALYGEASHEKRTLEMFILTTAMFRHDLEKKLVRSIYTKNRK